MADPKRGRVQRLLPPPPFEKRMKRKEKQDRWKERGRRKNKKYELTSAKIVIYIGGFRFGEMI